MEQPRSERLVAAETQLLRLKSDVAAVEDAYARVGDARGYDADVKRERLRPQVAAARGDLADFETMVMAMREEEALVSRLRPKYTALDTKARTAVATIKARNDVPSRPEMLELHACGRELKHLAQVLFEVTQDPAFRRPFDPVEELRWSWHQQAQERARCFTHHLSRPHLPAHAAPEWLAEAQRVTALHDAVKEVAV